MPDDVKEKTVSDATTGQTPMPSNTPPPWRTVHSGSNTKADFAAIVPCDPVRFSAGETIASGPLRQNNAAHIVKCVNSHQALVDALTQMVKQFADIPGMAEMVHDERMAVMNAREALALARA